MEGKDAAILDVRTAIERIAFFQDSRVVLRRLRRSPAGWLQLLRLAAG